jgi:hypothetical protein
VIELEVAKVTAEAQDAVTTPLRNSFSTNLGNPVVKIQQKGRAVCDVATTPKHTQGAAPASISKSA